MYLVSRSIPVFLVLFLFCTGSEKKEKTPAPHASTSVVEQQPQLTENVPEPLPADVATEPEIPIEEEDGIIVEQANPVCDSIFNLEVLAQRDVRRIGAAERKDFFGAYFSTPDPDCYQETSNSSISGIRLNGKKFCEFYGNPIHFCRVYTINIDEYDNQSYTRKGIHTLLASVLKLHDTIFDTNSCDTLIEIGLGKVAGIPPVLSKSLYKHINPAIVKWGINNFLPAPDDSILGRSCREIYSELYSHFMRSLYFTLCWLEFSPGRIADEYAVYVDSCKSSSFNGLSYLQEHFNRENPYDSDHDRENFFTPSPVYAGFWLRRFGDGSYQSLKAAVIRILESYDYEIFSDIFYKDRLNRPHLIREYEGMTTKDTMMLSFKDFDLYIEGCVNYYGASDSKAGDTILLYRESYTCSTDTLLSFAIQKQEKIPDVTLTATGRWGFFVQGEPEKGGIGRDMEFGLFPAGNVSFQLSDGKSHTLREVFKKENIPLSEDRRKELKRRKDMYSANGSWNDVEPAEMVVDVKWNEAQTGKNRNRVIKVVYSYGD